MKYNESNISFYKSDLEKVRARPALFIGSLDIGIFTILREPADNAVDEARAGRNKYVRIYVNNDTITVIDGGAGIPVKTHPGANISTLTHILTNLQSSGKISAGAYKSSRGSHGVGLKATNALASEFEVWTFRQDAGNKWYHTKFAKGIEQTKVAPSAPPPKMPDGFVAKYGTVVRFTPDRSILGKKNLHSSDLLNWCKIAAYMNSNFAVTLWFNGKSKTWKFENGIRDYLQKVVEDNKATLLTPKIITTFTDNVDLALCFSDVEGCQVEFFTNTIKNAEMGIHADMMFKAITDAIKPYKGKLEFTPSDLQEGMIGICNAKIDAPQFDSQTKEKLVDVRIKEPIYNDLLKTFADYFQKNPGVARQIVSRAAELRKRTNDFLKDKKLIKNVTSAKKSILAKLASVVGNTPIQNRELYIVEGDSAGGSAKSARYKPFQAVLPIKGKPLNVIRATKDKINKDNEISSILAAVGLDLRKEKPIDTVQYGKIIFLTDADVDGCHINCLLFGVFWKYLPELFKTGKIYVARGPMFKGNTKNGVYFGHTKESIFQQAKTKNVNITYLKGWGEVSPGDLKEIAFNPETRELVRVTWPPTAEGRLRFERMLDKDASERRKLMGISRTDE